MYILITTVKLKLEIPYFGGHCLPVLNLLTPKKVVVYAFAVLKRAGVRHLLITKRGVVETEISMHIVVLDQSILF